MIGLLIAVSMCAGPDYTVFQTGADYASAVDIGSDVAIVYGVNPSFGKRVANWRAQGYDVSMMTGISWGRYEDYYGDAANLKREEIQTSRTGRLFMHGNSDTVGYNVPTPAYVDYIKRLVEPAVDLGVRAVYLEEPEFWAETGWSEGFKRAWETRYGEPWVAPDSSVDAQYQASLLKYELYFDALREVIGHIKARAREQGREIECHVPTHSLINYAHWRIVSPESRLMDLEEMDGYIAQVWTGTARTPNVYRGKRKERTFETAYLEYGQVLGMVRPTGRKVWFLHDPIEDNPNYSWANYRFNYEETVVASLLWPEVHRFEVMPWPNRIFQGRYPKVDLDTKSEDREGIPAEYATEILVVINALNDMKQADVRRESGTDGIGILVSDTMMFQRANPTPSDGDLSSFYGLALPLLKAGVPLEPVQLETILTPGALAPYRVLVLTYEGQKPLKSAYHDAIEDWVRGGGSLLFVGDGTDPYNRVKAWWNDQGARDATPDEDLFARLGLDNTARHEPVAVGAGHARVLYEKPRALARFESGGEKVREAVAGLLAARGTAFETQNHLLVRRGPYVVAAVMDESTDDTPLVLTGRFIDLFDPQLGVATSRRMAPGTRALLYDLAWGGDSGPRVLAAAARVRDARSDTAGFHFSARGPEGTRCRMRVRLGAEPGPARTEPALAVEQTWDAASGTLLLGFDNQGAAVKVSIPTQ